MNTPHSNVPAGSATNSQHASAAASSRGQIDQPQKKPSRPGNFDARKTLEALLLLAFLAFGNLYADSPPGSCEALHKLTLILRRYAAEVLSSWRVVNPWLVAEDVVQELWTRFLTRKLAQHFDEKRSGERAPFLFGVLRIIMFETVRKGRYRCSATLTADVIDPSPSPAEIAAMLEMQADMAAAICDLQPTLAKSLLARYWPEQYPTEALGMSAVE